MARSARKSTKPSARNGSAAFAIFNRFPMRVWLAKLRDVAAGLGIISAVSFTPQSIVERLPENGQEAFAIATDIRALLVDVAGDTGTWLGDLLGSLADHDLEVPASIKDLGAWLPEFRLPDLPELPWAEPKAVDGKTLPTTAGSFSTAKDYLYNKVYFDHRETFYCGCRYSDKGAIDLGSCGLTSLSSVSRARRVEAEHVFPAAQFGQSRQCWREPKAFKECSKDNGETLSGRDCCQRVDPVFEAAHNDLINLYPAVGQINGQRSNYNWGMVSRGERFGECEIRIDSSIRRVQPPADVRGDIARTMLYMRDTYGFRLSSQDQQLYKAWNNGDPPDAWEIERDKRIKAIQRHGNEYVENFRKL
ncbi:deoxyribonuclease I [Thiocystis violacea]|nr:endonuclease [Thiocystis violacea]MBK1723850.1 deoxyribonuclease I [Thiocystis violacea]